MNKLLTVFVVIAVLLAVFFLLGPFYILSEGEQAVVTRFGAIVDQQTEAGLKFKMPMVDNVVKYPERILSWDGEPRRLPTKANQFIWVDVTARWKITDPELYYSAVNTVDQGYARLDDIIDSSVRTIISRYDLEESVRNSNFIIERGTVDALPQVEGEDVQGVLEQQGLQATAVQRDFPRIQDGRRKLSQQILDRSKNTTPEFGIELVDVVIRQIRYSDELTESVYQRMIAERKQIAQQYRSIGEGAKQNWLGKQDNERQRILSEAYRESQEIRGTAEAQSAQIYANAYNVDRNFFEFWRSIDSYRRTMPAFRKTFTTDMEYFKFLYDPNAR